MKIIKSLYDKDQKPFFDRYANLIPTLKVLSWIATIISFSTGIGIVYNIVSSKLGSSPAPISIHQITAISWVVAAILAGFCEIGIRKFLPYSVRVFLYKRWQGLDRVMSLFILSVCGLLLAGSITLSFKGSFELVEIVTEPVAATTHKADQQHSTKIASIESQYSSDKAAIEETYSAQIAGINSKYAGLIGKQDSEIVLYTRKEQRTGKSYQSRKQVHRGNIAKLQAEQGAQLAAIQEAKRKELSNLSDQKRTASSKAETSHSTVIAAIDRKNRTTAATATEKADLYGGGLAWITVLAMIILILSITILEVHRKGSGIVEQVIVSNYDFSPSAVSRFFSMAKEKMQQKVHSQITKWEKSTPPPIMPSLDHELLDMGTIEQERISIEVEKLPNGKYVIPSRFKDALDQDKSDLFQFEEYGKNGCGFSKNMSTDEEVISATIPVPKTDRKEAPTAAQNLAGDNTPKSGSLGNIPPDSPINRLSNKKDIDKARLSIDRSKKRYTEKQLKRVKSFYDKYIKKHDKKPNYKTIAVGLELGERAVGDYVRYLKKEGAI